MIIDFGQYKYRKELEEILKGLKTNLNIARDGLQIDNLNANIKEVEGLLQKLDDGKSKET